MSKTTLRKMKVTVGTVGLACVGGVIVSAAVTFHQGPSFTDLVNNYTVRLFAEASGLGNQDLAGRIAFNATIQYTCQNNGGNVAPGQPQPVSALAEQRARAETKNGRATIDLVASLLDLIPATKPGRQAGCPNNQWTGIDPQVVGNVSATGRILHGNQQLFSQTINNVQP